MIYHLEFENSLGNRRPINRIETETQEVALNEAMKCIRKFCEDRHFTIYYYRTWQTPEGETCFDVGSHTEFFYLKSIKK